MRMTLWQTGQVRYGQLAEKDLSSREAEILLAVERNGPESLRAQIERQIPTPYGPALCGRVRWSPQRAIWRLISGFRGRW